MITQFSFEVGKVMESKSAAVIVYFVADGLLDRFGV